MMLMTMMRTILVIVTTLMMILLLMMMMMNMMLMMLMKMILTLMRMMIITMPWMQINEEEKKVLPNAWSLHMIDAKKSGLVELGNMLSACIRIDDSVRHENILGRNTFILACI